MVNVCDKNYEVKLILLLLQVRFMSCIDCIVIGYKVKSNPKVQSIKLFNH